MSRLTDFLGPQTLQRLASDSKLYTLVRFLDEMLYASSTGPRLDDNGKPVATKGSEYFQCPERVWVSDLPTWIGKHLGNEKNYVHTTKALEMIREELEKLAVREVNP